MVAMNIANVLPVVGRKWRRPKHTFQIRMRPYAIQPFFLAPVLPGETMKQLLIQSRCVTDPIKNALIGWWLEYYVFYVKHRDLDARDTLVNMALDPSANTSSLNSAASIPTYHYGSAPDWTLLCLQRVVDQYFRDEDETWNTALIDTLPKASAFARGENWQDNLMPDANMPDADPNDTSFQALEPQQAQWEYLRAMKMTDMTYEQWLGTYGVHVQGPEEAHKPELIRYLREWSYPTNTVDPATGTPTSCVSWSIAERADKDRFFREPGWLFGCTITRPKVYMSRQAGSAASLMNTGMTWLPAIMMDQPWTSLLQVPTSTGPIPGMTDVGGYWIDLRDLLLYGDQFVNFALTATDANFTALPTAAGQKKYAPDTDIDALFVAPAKNLVRQDGIVSLAVLGAQQDTT